jgi:hypothetical protein
MCGLLFAVVAVAVSMLSSKVLHSALTPCCMRCICCMCRLNASSDDAATANGADTSGATAVQIDLEAFKIVYIAPMKALVQEVS